MARKAMVKEEEEEEEEENPPKANRAPRLHIEHIGRKRVAVSSIFFIQGTLSDKFRDGRSLEAYIAALNTGELDLPDAVRILEWPNLGYITLDHRRLYCLKEHSRTSRTELVTIADVYKFPDDLMRLLEAGGIFHEFVWKFRRMSATLVPRKWGPNTSRH